MTQVLTYAITALFVILCILMTLVILIQRPRSEGLGTAFGAGMTESLFGADTTNVLTKVTIWFAGGFFACTLILAFLAAHRTSGGLEQRLESIEMQQAIKELNQAANAMGNGTNQTASESAATPVTPPAPAAETTAPAPAPEPASPPSPAPEPAPAMP